MGVLTQLTANQLCAAQHIRPLVVSAELHIAPIVLEHVVEVVALHDHVVELQEAQALLHALLVTLRPQHIVHREACAYLPQQLNVVQRHQPLGVIQHQCLVIGEIDKLLHLPLKALSVVNNVLSRQHLAHIRPTGGVTDHGSAVADQGDGLVSGHLQPLHQAQGHKMPHMQRIRRAVKSNVEGCLSVVHHFTDLVLVGHLSDESPANQFLINTHVSLFLSSVNFVPTGEKTPPVSIDRGRCKNRGTTSYSPQPHGQRPHWVSDTQTL